jgi:hypothetical protein
MPVATKACPPSDIILGNQHILDPGFRRGDGKGSWDGP